MRNLLGPKVAEIRVLFDFEKAVVITSSATGNHRASSTVATSDYIQKVVAR